MERYDLIVIGAGINGAAIARDAALRGYSTLVLDKGDAAGGTTQYSSRLIHGGLRYLEQFQFPLVHEALQERSLLLRTAPHLVRPLPFLLPVYRHTRRPLWYVGIGLFLYDMASFFKHLPWHRLYWGRTAAAAMEPGIDKNGLSGAATYYDAQVPFPERLTVALLRDAESHGAVVRTYEKVTGITKGGGRVTGTMAAGKAVAADAVINAAGPWVDEVNQEADSLARAIGGTKGTHIVTERWQDAPRHAIYLEARRDGRPIFILPWEDRILIGTTDIPYEGDLDAVAPTEAEVRYLLAEANDCFPNARLTEKSVLHAYAGVRPLPVVRKELPGDIPRRHIIRHYAKEGLKGYFAVISGKITTHRSLAEQTVDRASRHIAKRAGPCTTKAAPLFGGDIRDIDAYRSEAWRRHHPPWLTRGRLDALIALYGTEHEKVLRIAEESKALQAPLGGVIAAAAVYSVRKEWARHLPDLLLRRLCIVQTGRADERTVRGAAALMARELCWTKARREREIEDFRKLIALRYRAR